MEKKTFPWNFNSFNFRETSSSSPQFENGTTEEYKEKSAKAEKEHKERHFSGGFNILGVKIYFAKVLCRIHECGIKLRQCLKQPTKR